MKHIFAILLLAFISFNCEKNDPDPVPLLPTVTTAAASSITANTALSGGSATTGSGPSISSRGVCWGTVSNPDINGNHTNNGSGNGAFTSAITGLSANTVYFVRAYATNSAGTTYGNEITFTTTTSTTALPTVTTAAASAITSNFANSGGTISSDGGAPITVRGVCWSTTANPTTALSTKTTDGTGIGSFTSAITGLAASTTYHIRAYATNSVGTAYGNDLSFTTASSTPDVYVGGYEAGTMVEFVARTWKNGVQTTLTDGTKDARVNSIYVSGTDLYAAGSEVDGVTSGDNQPKLWKNGTLVTALSSACHGICNSVFVSAGNVHVAGGTVNTTLPPCSAQPRAITWKNNVLTEITDGTKYAEAFSIFVSGADTYVAGMEMFPANGVFIAKIWKNGVVTELTDGSAHAHANAVFVSGTDVYVGGEEERPAVAPFTAKIWKNGIGTFLTTGIYDSYVKSVYVSGTDVYAVGWEGTADPTKDVATIWKNGVPTHLTNGANDARAYAVFVFGTDVYVAGYENNGTKDIAKVWKNGVVTALTNGVNDARALSIFVK